MMKKLIKYGLILLGIGSILLVFAISKGGMRTVWFDGMLPKIVNNKKVITKNKQINNFSNIQINVKDINVKVIAGKEYAVKYIGKKEIQPKVNVTKGVLKITSTKTETSAVSVSVGFDFGRNQKNNELIITVPRNKTLTNVQIVAQGDSIKLQETKIESLLLQSEDADINISNAKIAVNQKIKTEDGDISVKHTSIVAGTIASGDGDATISDAILTDVKLKNQDGDIDISKAELNSGSSRSADGDMTFKKVKITNGYQATTEDGDITVSGMQAAGYKTRSTDGDNRLYTKKSSTGRLLKLNSEQDNIFTATTEDGDIHIR